jgi:hypothetical protein
MTVRQVFYQATVRGLVEKAESGYTKVQTDLTVMRRAGDLPYDWLADNTRWQRKPRTFDSVEQALRDTARFYRKSLWTDADCYAEIWLEKDALSGVIYPVTSLYDVPLMVARGYASLSFLYDAADAINDLVVPAYIYHCRDYDPSGVNAAEKIEETLRELAPDAEIYFERIAVTEQQIADWDLPTRPTKASDTRAKAFGSALSVELCRRRSSDICHKTNSRSSRLRRSPSERPLRGWSARSRQSGELPDEYRPCCRSMASGSAARCSPCLA